MAKINGRKEEVRLKLNKNKKWLEYNPKEKQHTLHYFECIKPGITHLIYWQDEKIMNCVKLSFRTISTWFIFNWRSRYCL